jgi:hypothetical protein
MEGWAVPQRPESGLLLMRWEEARLERVATWQSDSEMSIHWPLPVRVRWRREARMELEV